MGFSKLKSSLAGKGIKNPGALASSIGRKKYSKPLFDKYAAKGTKMSKAKPVSSISEMKAKIKSKGMY